MVASLTRVQHLKYVSVSMLVYIVIDYIQTFPEEVAYMWRTNCSLVKILFFVTRYLPFVDLPLMILYNEGVGFSPATCHGLFGAANLMCVSATGIAEGLLFMRAHALSKQSKAVRWYLTAHYALVQAACISLSLYFVQSLSFTPPSGLPPPPATTQLPCIPYASKLTHLSAVFALVFFNQLTITALSFYFVLTNFRESRGPLIQLLWRDGVYYFVLMSSITIANFVMSLQAPMEYRFILAMPQRVLHATVATRMVLRMRSSARSEDDLTRPQLSTMRFRRFKTSGEHTLDFSSTQRSHATSKTSKYTSTTLDECPTPTTLIGMDFRVRPSTTPATSSACSSFQHYPTEMLRGVKSDEESDVIVVKPKG